MSLHFSLPIDIDKANRIDFSASMFPKSLGPEKKPRSTSMPTVVPQSMQTYNIIKLQEYIIKCYNG